MAPGRIEPRRTLPSFLFLEDGQPVGVYAREQGALVPTAGAFSEILAVESRCRPHGEDPAVGFAGRRPRALARRSFRALPRHISRAWDNAATGSPLGEQEIVLTVPASFDEEARELTVKAAQEAGIDAADAARRARRGLLFLDRRTISRDRARSLFDGQIVLVCDVGGGTSDFTLIRVVAKATASISPAPPSASICCWAATTSTSPSPGWSKRSSASRCPSGSAAGCAANAPPPKRSCSRSELEGVEITVLGAGSSLIGGTLKTEILREEALELALEGFLPPCQLAR